MINFLLPFHQHFDQSLSHALTTKRVASGFAFVPIGKTSTWSHLIKNYDDMLPHVSWLVGQTNPPSHLICSLIGQSSLIIFSNIMPKKCRLFALNILLWSIVMNCSGLSEIFWVK